MVCACLSQHQLVASCTFAQYATRRHILLHLFRLRRPGMFPKRGTNLAHTDPPNVPSSACLLISSYLPIIAARCQWDVLRPALWRAASELARWLQGHGCRCVSSFRCTTDHRRLLDERGLVLGEGRRTSFIRRDRCCSSGVVPLLPCSPGVPAASLEICLTVRHRLL